jgi:hypothetical protein
MVLLPDEATAADIPVVVPDAGPWITLAYADALDLLTVPGWPVLMVDMVLEELTRSETVTSAKIGDWIRSRNIWLVPSDVCRQAAGRRQRNLGEMAIQETMQMLALSDPPRRGISLFEDHKIARASFLLPEGCIKVTTRAWLTFLERQQLIPSARAIERKAILAGRQFSRLRYPPDV